MQIFRIKLPPQVKELTPTKPHNNATNNNSYYSILSLLLVFTNSLNKSEYTIKEHPFYTYLPEWRWNKNKNIHRRPLTHSLVDLDPFVTILPQFACLPFPIETSQPAQKHGLNFKYFKLNAKFSEPLFFLSKCVKVWKR